mmetsp:Transcript_164060/g.526090  ORF Transcript_164060/g.526090 Transcript_164060/m.526090 type:complete len:212 (+) Transcript_164060:602-1237(+)
MSRHAHCVQRRRRLCYRRARLLLDRRPVQRRSGCLSCLGHGCLEDDSLLLRLIWIRQQIRPHDRRADEEEGGQHAPAHGEPKPGIDDDLASPVELLPLGFPLRMPAPLGHAHHHVNRGRPQGPQVVGDGEAASGIRGVNEGIHEVHHRGEALVRQLGVAAQDLEVAQALPLLDTLLHHREANVDAQRQRRLQCHCRDRIGRRRRCRPRRRR